MKAFTMAYIYLLELILYFLCAMVFEGALGLLCLGLLAVVTSVAVYCAAKKFDCLHIPFIAIEIAISICGIVSGFCLNPAGSYQNTLGLAAEFYIIIIDSVLKLILSGFLLSMNERKK